MKRFKNILFVFDSAMESRVALERAVTLAENNEVRLTVVEVMDDLVPWVGRDAVEYVKPEGFVTPVMLEH